MSSKIHKIIEGISAERGLDYDNVKEIINSAVIQLFAEKEMAVTLEEVQSKRLIDSLSRFEILHLKNLITEKLNSIVIQNNLTKIKSMQHKLISCKIKHHTTNKYILDWDGIELEVSSSNLLPMERLYKDSVYKFCIEKVYTKDNRVRTELSRNSENFVKALLYEHIPEDLAKEIEVVKIARIPGFKSIISVYSETSDPVGVCIGSRGVRMKFMVSELNGERVEVVRHDEDKGKILKKLISKIEHRSIIGRDQIIIIVDNDAAVSQAIGRSGLNVKILHKFFKASVEVFTEDSYAEHQTEKHAKIMEVLSAESIFETEIERQVLAKKLMDIKGIDTLTYEYAMEISEHHESVFCRLAFWYIKNKISNTSKYDEAELVDIQSKIESLIEDEHFKSVPIWKIANIILRSEQTND